jgi:hypothetical protein
MYVSLLAGGTEILLTHTQIEHDNVAAQILASAKAGCTGGSALYHCISSIYLALSAAT